MLFSSEEPVRARLRARALDLQWQALVSAGISNASECDLHLEWRLRAGFRDTSPGGIMKIRFSVLRRLLAGEIIAAEFLRAAGAAPGQAQDGAIAVQADEDVDLRISLAEIRMLCRCFYSKALGARELAAIADALLRSGRVAFADDRAAALMEEMSAADAPFTAIRALSVLGTA
jgi:hypothetical protein